MNINFEPFPELTTEHLRLRQLSDKDENEIFAIRSNPEIAKYLDRPLIDRVEEAADFITKINRGIRHNEWIYWGITQNNSPVIIGTICLWKFSPAQAKAEIGFELLPGYQGKGIMYEAAKEVLSYGFNNLGLNMIDGEVAPENYPSINLMKKFGFIKALKSIDPFPETDKTIIYRLFKPDFEKTVPIQRNFR